MRTRVLNIVLSLHRGGLERVLGDLLRGLDSDRFDIHVLALEFLGDLSRGLDQHGTLHVMEPMSRWSMLWPMALAREIRRIGPDIVHTHSGVWYKGSLAAKMAGVPILFHTDHGRQSPDPFVHRLLDGIASRRTDLVIAVSEELARRLGRKVVHDPARVKVVPNGIDTDRFRGAGDGRRIRSELSIDPGAPVLGSMGRLDPIKRCDLMIEAFRQLLDSWTDGAPPELVIAGDGPAREELRRLVPRLGLEGRVHLPGWRDDVEDLHDSFTLFTMSSRSEGTSIALLEAMSSGLCPVVTAVGGNPAVLGSDLSHRLCPSEDPGALVDAWRAALGSPERRRRDGDVARRRVVEHFSVRHMLDRYEALYSSAVASGPTGNQD